MHVPTHMFKIITLDTNGGTASAAFLMPNRPIAEDRPLESYKVSLEELERLTGLDLSAMQSRTDLCSVTKCVKPTNHRMLGWRHYGFIDEARNLEELRVSVKNAIDDGFVDGDNFLIPKAVRDRMQDLGIGEDTKQLFPDEEKYQQAVLRGLNVFKRKSAERSEG